LKKKNNSEDIEILVKFAQIRCGDYWNYYSEFLVPFISQYVKDLAPNDPIISVEFYKKLYMTINKSIVKFLYGNSIEFLLEIQDRRTAKKS
jgi:hypothetical protein